MDNLPMVLNINLSKTIGTVALANKRLFAACIFDKEGIYIKCDENVISYLANNLKLKYSNYFSKCYQTSILVDNKLKKVSFVYVSIDNSLNCLIFPIEYKNLLENESASFSPLSELSE